MWHPRLLWTSTLLARIPDGLRTHVTTRFSVGGGILQGLPIPALCIHGDVAYTCRNSVELAIRNRSRTTPVWVVPVLHRTTWSSVVLRLPGLLLLLHFSL